MNEKSGGRYRPSPWCKYKIRLCFATTKKNRHNATKYKALACFTVTKNGYRDGSRNTKNKNKCFSYRNKGTGVFLRRFMKHGLQFGVKNRLLRFIVLLSRIIIIVSGVLPSTVTAFMVHRHGGNNPQT